MNKKICFFMIVFVLFNNWDVFADENNNQDITTYLHMAVFNGDLEMVKSEIEKGADVNHRGEDGWTPLMTAVHYGYIDIVKLLISNGADPNIKETFQGNTPLHEAVFWDQPVEFARVIIGSGNVDVNIKNVYGLTPLHYVASNDTPDDYAYAELLINSGADVNLLDNFGDSAFHTAVRTKREDMSRLMIENGAEINKIGPNGRIALHDSAAENSKEITELLILHGGICKQKKVRQEIRHFIKQLGITELMQLRY